MNKNKLPNKKVIAQYRYIRISLSRFLFWTQALHFPEREIRVHLFSQSLTEIEIVSLLYECNITRMMKKKLVKFAYNNCYESSDKSLRYQPN